MDDQKGFLGAMDRYDFKLIGKKEKFIYYNSFNLTNYKVCDDQKILSTRHFPNPDCVRWELHRVWKIEATLKPNFRHAYHRRVFYWDEDMLSAGQAENYDAAGKLYRITNPVAYPFFDSPGGAAGTTHHLDLQTGIYSISGQTACQGCGWWPVDGSEYSDTTFSPDAMAGSGIR